jgi:hypothetical protein
MGTAKACSPSISRSTSISEPEPHKPLRDQRERPDTQMQRRRGARAPGRRVLFDVVVRGFAGDDDVVDVAFAESCV